MTSRRPRLVALVMIARATCVLAATPPIGWEDAAQDYLSQHHRFARKVDRSYAVSRVEDVTDELGVSDLSSKRVFSFPRRAAAPISHGLLLVDSRGEVTSLVDTSTINMVFDRAVIGNIADKEARLLAECFLRIRYFDGFRNSGYPLGIKVVSSVGEVPWLPNTSSQVDGDISIQPPQLLASDDGRCLVLHSWAGPGGDLLRHEVCVTGYQISRYTVIPARRWVGGLIRGH